MTPNETRIVKMFAATPEQLAKIDEVLTPTPTTEPTRSTAATLFTFAETARKLGLSRATIWRMVRAGDIKTVPLGSGHWERVPAAEIERIATPPKG